MRSTLRRSVYRVEHQVAPEVRSSFSLRLPDTISEGEVARRGLSPLQRAQLRVRPPASRPLIAYRWHADPARALGESHRPGALMSGPGRELRPPQLGTVSSG